MAGDFDHPVRCASAGCVTAARLAADHPLNPLGLYGSAALRRLSSAEPATKYAVVLIGLPELALEQIRMERERPMAPFRRRAWLWMQSTRVFAPGVERSAVSVDQVNTGSVAGCSGPTGSGR